MGIQNAVEVSLVYGAEGSLNTPAGAGGTSKTIRRVSSNLALGKDTYTSQEARTDQQINDMRHGTKRPGGAIQGELSSGTYDDFLEALLRGTWTAGVTAAAADYTTVTGAVTTGAALQPLSIGTLAWTAGDPVAKGFRIGDVINLVGTPAAANDNVNFRITGFGGAGNKTISVTPAPVAFAANAITSMTVVGKKLQNGTLKRSFTIEQKYPTAGFSELFTGMRVDGGQFRLPPNGLCTGSFNFMGVDMVTKSAGAYPYFTAATAPGTAGIFSGPAGTMRAAGAEQAIVTGLDINVTNNLSADPVVGSLFVPEIFYGNNVVTGNVSAFLSDAGLMSAFVNETEVDIVAVMTAALAAGQTVPDFLAFNLQRVKLGGASKQIGANGGVIVTYPFVGLLAAANPGVDACTLTIQRSTP